MTLVLVFVLFFLEEPFVLPLLAYVCADALVRAGCLYPVVHRSVSAPRP